MAFAYIYKSIHFTNSGARDIAWFKKKKKAYTEQGERGILLCDVQAHMWPNLALWLRGASAGPRKRPNTKHQCVRTHTQTWTLWAWAYYHCRSGTREDQNTLNTEHCVRRHERPMCGIQHNKSKYTGRDERNPNKQSPRDRSIVAPMLDVMLS